MALMLLPARPITREMACTGTWTFLQAFSLAVVADAVAATVPAEAVEAAGVCCTELLRITSFQPSSRFDDANEEFALAELEFWCWLDLLLVATS